LRALGLRLRRAARQLEPALPFHRNEGIRIRGRRPRLVVHAADPELVEGQAAGVHHVEHLHGCFRLLRAQGFAPEQACELAQRLACVDRTLHELGAREADERILKSGDGCLLRGIQGALTGPAEGLQTTAHDRRPDIRGTARAPPRQLHTRALEWTVERDVARPRRDSVNAAR
jgi:hypothetical protein